MKNDDFGDRMKHYEGMEAGRRALPLLPICARLDGKGFSKWTHGLERPYDKRLSDIMVHVTKRLVEQTHAKIGYTQSDEISLAFLSTDYNSETYFDGKFQKLCSVLASMATAEFNSSWLALSPDTYDADATKRGLALFDCRVWTVPNEVEGANVFLWREKDATKNSISMAARHYYSHNELHEKSGSEMQEMLFQKGKNWNDYPAFFKRGTFVRRETVLKKLEPEILAKIPEANRPAPDTLVERSHVVALEMPPFSQVLNRADVIFKGETPKVEPAHDYVAQYGPGCGRCGKESGEGYHTGNVVTAEEFFGRTD